MTRILYYAPAACSLAAHIVLEESGLPYEGRKLDLAAGDQRAAQFLAVNERGRVPALVEDGFVLTECAAIMRHVARQVPEKGLWPADLRDQAVADEWLGWLASAHHVTYAHIPAGPSVTPTMRKPWPASASRGPTPTGTSAP